MAALLKGLASLVMAGLTSITTVAAHGHIPAIAAPGHHAPASAHQPAGSTDMQNIDVSMYSSYPPKPDPTPTPASDQAASGTPGSSDGQAPAAPAPAPVGNPAAVQPAPAPAAPPVVIGSAQQALINQDRAAAGLPPLTWSSCLAGIAAVQSQAMAARGSIFHGTGVNQDFGCGLGSRQTGENVGYWSAGINDGQLNTMFMNSPEHRANIMGPYHYVGTAWVTASNGFGYITVEFG
jgi:uncharacterized protein YkwD